jgi:hypothetical protein
MSKRRDLEDSVETIIQEKKRALEPRCVFCDRPRDEFNSPGKSLRGRWCCPDCRALIA